MIFYPLEFQIISNEDGTAFYKNKIKKQISEISENEEKFKINYVTILLTGKSGNGKSTLINVLLKLKKMKEQKRELEILSQPKSRLIKAKIDHT